MPLPSVLLHDHLDGGLRVSTILDLAEKRGYDSLPTTDPAELAAWFDQSEAGSLEQYLEAFDHTIAVMQDQESLERVAYEAVIDLAGDGVVYVEERVRPRHFVRDGLTPSEVIDSIASGMGMGAAETGMEWRLIVCALRQLDDSLDEAETAASSVSLGVAGFDIAGPEHGHPPTDHLGALRLARDAGLGITIHAGESARELGVAYMDAAVATCGADRLGHGIELIDDCMVEDGEIIGFGPVATTIRDRQIPLEVCPSSNVATKGMTPRQHPIGLLHRAGFNITLSTDNRLMSNTTMSAEMELARRHHGFDLTDLADTTRRSLAAAFCDDDAKQRLWEEVIAPAYADAGAVLDDRWRR